MNECVFPIQEHETSQNWLLRVYSPSETDRIFCSVWEFYIHKNLKALGHFFFCLCFKYQVPSWTNILCFASCLLLILNFQKSYGTGFLNFNFDSSNGLLKFLLSKYHIKLRKVILMTFDKKHMRKMTCFSMKFWYIYCNNCSLNVFLCPTWSPDPQEWLTIWQNWLLSRKHDI